MTNDQELAFIEAIHNHYENKFIPVIFAKDGKTLECKECQNHSEMLALHRCMPCLDFYFKNKKKLSKEGFYANMKKLQGPSYMDINLVERLKEKTKTINSFPENLHDEQ